MWLSNQKAACITSRHGRPRRRAARGQGRAPLAPTALNHAWQCKKWAASQRQVVSREHGHYVPGTLTMGLANTHPAWFAFTETALQVLPDGAAGSPAAAAHCGPAAADCTAFVLDRCLGKERRLQPVMLSQCRCRARRCGSHTANGGGRAARKQSTPVATVLQFTAREGGGVLPPASTRARAAALGR